MILRFNSEPSQVFFMEVSEDSTITIKKWSEVKTLLGTNYTKFAHRRLKWDRPDDTRDAV